MFNHADPQAPGRDPSSLVRVRFGPASWLANTVVVGALYYLLINLSTLLYSPEASIAPLFPHMGFSVAVFLIRGMRLWPGILAGSIAGNYYLGASDNGVVIASLISISMVTQALVAAALIGRYIERPGFLIPERDTLKAVLVTGPVAALIAPTGSVLTLYALSTLEASAAIPLWLTWWSAASISILLFTPFFLLLWPESYPTNAAGKLRYLSWLLFAALALLAGSVALDRPALTGRGGNAATERMLELVERRLPAVSHPLSPFGSLVRLIETDPRLDKQQFAAFARPLVQQPSVTAVAWLIAEPATARDGPAGFSVHRSLEDYDAGTYLDDSELLRRALRRGVETTDKAVSALVEHPEHDHKQLVMAKAADLPGAGPGASKHLVVVTVDPVELLFTPLKKILGDTGARFQVRDVTDADFPKLVAGGLGGDIEPFWQRDFNVADRRWRLEAGLPVEYWWWPRETLINRLYLLLGVMVALLSTYLVMNSRTLDHRQQVNERRWREREARLAAIIESPPEAIVAVDTDFRLISFNEAFKLVCQQTLRHTPRIGTPVDQVIGVDEKARAQLRHRLSLALAGEQVIHEATLRDELGQEMFCESTYNPIQHTDGEIFGVSIMIRDITEQSRLEAALKRQVEELQRWRESTLGREGRILELKHEVNAALAACGQPPRYEVTSAGEQA